MNILNIPLEECSLRQVQLRNKAIQSVANRVYAIGGIEFYLRSSSVLPQTPVQLDCLFFGQSLSLIVDLECANTFLAPAALRLEEMSEDAIALFLLANVQKMPKNMQILSMSLKNQDFYTYDSSFEAVSYATGESLNWHIAFAHNDKFPLASLIEALDQYLKGVMSSSLASLPISLPLVASAIDIGAADLEALAIGDVLLIGGAP